MRAIAIYVEGGGDSAAGKAAIRNGFDRLLAALKDQARRRRWRWKLVACGGRGQTKDAFLNARVANPDTHTLLLVDSEAPVTAPPTRHLNDRDGWDLSGVPDDDVHLMVQVMETWLAADPDALARYYGQRFRANALPAATDLETVAKDDVASALAQATRDTQKGEYHKIRHAGDLLQRVDPAKVRSRCPHCARFMDRVAAILET